MMFLHNVEAYQYFLIPFTSSVSCRTLLNLFVVGPAFPPFELNASYETHTVMLLLSIDKNQVPETTIITRNL